MGKKLLLFLSLFTVFTSLPAQKNIEPEMAKMREMVYTEDIQLNTIAEKIFSQCIFSKLFDPLPPALPNKWFSPGGGYVGQWIWDTQFVIAAYAPMGEHDVIRGVFDNYWKTIENNPEAPRGSYRYGMVPNYLKDWPPLGYSQIPILAWGVWQVYKQTGDIKLLEQSLPYLVTFDEWYSTERDVDNDGLIEFGAYKPIGKIGIVQTARYETFDFFPPMDNLRLTTHPFRKEGGEWYGNVEGVEQTCFLLMSEQAIVDISYELGKEEIAKRYKKIIKRRITSIQEKMWDPDKKFFYSLDRDTDIPIEVRCIQGFLTMCCNAATKEQARILATDLLDTKRWWCDFPVPTVAMDDPKFDRRLFGDKVSGDTIVKLKDGMKGFWRGDMWPVTTYLVAYGLNRYGYYDEARMLTDKIVDLFINNGINERYNGINGQPLGVQGLGMSCSVWSMIVENYYGIINDYRTIRLPEKAKGRHLKLGQLELRYPDDYQVELCSGFKRRFKVVFPKSNPKARLSVSCDGAKLPKDALTLSASSVEFITEPNKRYIIQPDK